MRTAEAARKKDPSEPSAWFALGLVANLRGNYPEAQRLLRWALVMDPGKAAAWNELGNAYAKQHQWPEAVAAWRQALAVDPAYGSSAVNLERHGQRVGGAAIPDWRQLLIEPEETIKR